jgi:hypothetical protein
MPKMLHMIGFDTQRCAIERTLLTPHALLGAGVQAKTKFVSRL